LLASALGALSNNRRIDELLDGQIALNRLQIEDIKREDKVRHWSLRVHHVSDVMKLAFEFAAAFIVLAAAMFLGGAIWTAAHDNSLVIDAFDAPPDLAARGLTGNVIAGRIDDRLSAMEQQTDSIRVAGTYRQSWGDDIKVEISDTGISIGELYRYLVSWLGNEKHITGAIWHTARGIALSTRVGDDPAFAFDGTDTSIDAVVMTAAEHLYAETQPYRYAIYLNEHDRNDDSLAAFRALALRGSAGERPWAYTMWGQMLLDFGDVRGGLEKSRRAAELEPDLPNIWFNLADAEATSGHDEARLGDNRRALKLYSGAAARQLAAYAVAAQIPNTAREISETLGDYQAAASQARESEALADYNNSHIAAPLLVSEYLASDHDVAGARRAHADSGPGERDALKIITVGISNVEMMPLPVLAQAVAPDNWEFAALDLEAMERSPIAETPMMRPFGPVLILPWLAYADAKLGRFGNAHRLIDSTAPDCYLCLRMRGNVDAAQANPNGAAYWFARAIAAAPSIPFAYADWGAMLMRAGQYDAAISKFALANKKGPHFADPLELWGEALMQKNRSDLALVKFEEADQYAPNWGRLHLEWGNALLYANNRKEANKQLEIASHLDLSPADSAALARRRAAHG